MLTVFRFEMSHVKAGSREEDGSLLLLLSLLSSAFAQPGGEE